MKSQFFFKIFKILLILLKFNFSFSLKRKKYVIFDNTSVDEFSNLFSDQDVFVLNNRLDNIKKIYLSKKIIFFLTKNLNFADLEDIFSLISFVDGTIGFFNFIENNFSG